MYRKKSSNISVIGLGKLGLCTAACLAYGGYQVIGMDIREDHVKKLRQGTPPFFEPNLSELLLTTEKNLSFTNDVHEAVKKTDISFIIVPTPSKKNGEFSNKYIKEVLMNIAPLIKEKESFHLINIVSTVMPGSCENDFLPLIEKLSGKKIGVEIGLTYNPEFIAIGSVINDFLNPDLVLIGESDEKSGDIVQKIYIDTCQNTPHIARTNFINAEITKLALNCYCTMKISFANNLSALCDRIDKANACTICNILGLDSRIGEKYIKPGLGFGGPCFPRDNQAFISFIESLEGYSGLQRAVIHINNDQPKRAIQRISDAIEEYGGDVAVLGLSYKPGTYLTEQSQALEIVRTIADKDEVEKLRVYDPLAKEEGVWQLCSSVEECVQGANIVAILTPWEEFYTSDWRNLLSDKATVLDFWRQDSKNES